MSNQALNKLSDAYESLHRKAEEKRNARKLEQDFERDVIRKSEELRQAAYDQRVTKEALNRNAE